MFGAGIHSPEDRRFAGLAAAVVDDLLARDPVRATKVGDHRFDGRLPDLTGDGVDEFARVMQRHAAFLDSVDSRALSRVAAADLEVLRAGVASRLFDMTKVQPHLWNPLVWSPAEALYSLVSRDFAPAEQRSQSLLERLREVPEHLENARHTLGEMPAVHVETAIEQFSAIPAMLADLPEDMRVKPGLSDALMSATGAIGDHVSWLRSRLPGARRNPAYGPELYSGVLRTHLDAPADPDVLLAEAEESLEEVLDALASASAKLLQGSMADRSVIPKALDRLGDGGDVDDGNVLDVCAAAMESAVAFAIDRELVTVPDVDVRMELIPAVRRGVFPVYCNAPGPLERRELPTVIGIAPTPPSWSGARRGAHYREYNRHLIHNLMVHVGVPGHVLQQAQAREAVAPSAARAALPSTLFVEGWAVYAEELMAGNGFSVPEEPRASLRIQQLKMQLRIIVSTILDVRVHTRGMTEAEAKRLMSTRGFFPDDEIPGNWRRARLTCGQLASYFLGYQQIKQIVGRLTERNRNWSPRQVHDAVLAHGSVPPRVLPPLVGLE